MKIVCPGHNCLLDDVDKYVLENNNLLVEALRYPCPYCKEELHILNILLLNVSYLSADTTIPDVGAV